MPKTIDANHVFSRVFGAGIACFIATAAVPAAAASCNGRGIELQVLGSGGPELIGDRASTSYLIRRDGKPSVLVDSGGGSALRFAESGARVSDLDIVLFSHFHIDHSADFMALVKSSYFQDRTDALPVLGPGGNAGFPSTTQFLQSQFAKPDGSYRYLSGYLPSDGRKTTDAYALKPENIETDEARPKVVFNENGLNVSALRQHHGNVPALAWRVEMGGVSIVFSGDTDGKNLEKLAADADLLVAHNAIPESANGSILDLHMKPSQIGLIAARSNVPSLLLSHRMTRSLGQEESTRNAIAESWEGSVKFANDLDCFAVKPH